MLPAQFQASRDVVVDRHRRERVRPLEHHADAATQRHRIDPRRVDVVIVEEHLAGDVGAGNDFVKSIQAAQEGRLAAPRRADQGGDGLWFDRHRDILDSLVAAVEARKTERFDALGHGAAHLRFVALRRVSSRAIT